MDLEPTANNAVSSVKPSLHPAMTVMFGLVVSQLVTGFAVGVPTIIAVAVTERTAASQVVLLSGAALTGVVLSFVAGRAFGTHTRLGWQFAIGTSFLPVVLLLFLPRGLQSGIDGFALGLIGAHVASGIALGVGFLLGMRRRTTNTTRST